MSYFAASEGSWSVTGIYQPEYHSFTFESEESYRLQISLHQADSSKRSATEYAQPLTVTTDGDSDDVHCTHSQGEEHCILHSGNDTSPPQQAAPGSEQLSPPSPAMERYLYDHQRHERVAVSCINLTQDMTEQGQRSPLPASRSRLSSSDEDTRGFNKEKPQVQDTEE